MADRVRGLWEFSDLDGSEAPARLREQLEREPDDVGRAEIMAQLARVEGLRGRFDEGEHLLAEAENLAGDSRSLALASTWSAAPGTTSGATRRPRCRS